MPRHVVTAGCGVLALEAVRALHLGTCLVLALPLSSRKSGDNVSSALICKKGSKLVGPVGMKASDMLCIARGPGQGGTLNGATTVHRPRTLLHSSATLSKDPNRKP